ncbi:MAG: ABC transporter substrate-binding protein, partial [Acidobacteriota bacterium]
LLRAWSGEGRVRAVIAGATSEEALALAAAAEPLGVLVLSPSASSPALSGFSRYFFRNWPSDASEAEAAAEFAAYSLHATRVEVLADDNAYGRGLADAFARAFEREGRRAAVTIVAPGQVPAPAAGPPGVAFQAIFLAGYSGALLPAADGLRRAGDRRPILACSAFARADLLKKAPSWMDGICLLRPGPVSGDGGTEKAEFAMRFTARWGEPPDVYAAHAYDAVRILGAALAGSPEADAEALRSALLSARGFPGAAGPTSFTALGDVRRPIEVWVFDGGRPRPLKSVSDKVLPSLQGDVARLRLRGA